MTRRLTACCLALLLVPVVAEAAIRVNPDGVNVNMNGTTTVFLTFGGLGTARAAEAFWCGELVSAAPDLGVKCDPSTIFGRLPLRFDLSQTSGLNAFTDIMSIPESVARRARQAAEQGARSSFFYVRRFVNTAGGPDEYVAVTCRLAGGGARVPFALLDVKLAFSNEQPVLAVRVGETPPAVSAHLSYNGTGRLVGRWEVVLPGDEPPDARDLLPEASLPVEQRGSQRRYTEIGRFNVFLPPVGRTVLPGPDVSRLPSTVEGLYQILLRVEASDDKEADSNLRTVGAGDGVVHSGAVAGFPLPPLRYVVGSLSNVDWTAAEAGGVALLLPAPRATMARATPLDFAWRESRTAAFYRIEIRTIAGQVIAGAVVPRGTTTYRAPSFLANQAGDGFLQWRVVALDAEGARIDESGWRDLKLTEEEQ
jgi:hypothetical protein